MPPTWSRNAGCTNRGPAINYYEHHLGDYLRDTVHLSLAEDGAYLRLLAAYYIREGPLPPAVVDAVKLARPSSKADRAIVEHVLLEFFQLDDGIGWRNQRADEEIRRYAEKRLKAKASSTLGVAAREAKRLTERSTEGTTSPLTSHQKEETFRKPTVSSSPRPTVPCPYEAIVDRYHAALPELPRVKLMTAARQKTLRKFWSFVLTTTKSDGSRRASNADEALEWIAGYFARASDNDFLMGRGARSGEHANWQCDLDFLLTEKGMRHVIEKTRTGT